MKQVTRYDRGELRASINEDGYLEDVPIVGRVGIQSYRQPDGTVRREFRPPDEVFNADSLASFKGKPVTIGHPGAVTAKNARKHQVGTMMSDGQQDGDNVKVPLIIHADEAISKAQKGGARQLSLGYKLDLDESPGFYNQKTGEVVMRDDADNRFEDGLLTKDWQDFHAVQRNIRVNHLAIVTKARAGDMATLNLDGDEEITMDDDNNPTKGKTMQKLRLDSGLEYEAAPEVVVAYQALKQDAEDKAKELATVKTQITTLTAERDTLKADAADFDSKLEQARADAKEEIKARAGLEAIAAKHDVKCDGLDDLEVRKAVLGKLKPGLNLDGKDGTYIGVAFDMAVESAPIEAKRQTINQDRADPTPVPASGSKAAREKMIARQQGKETK